MNGLLPLEDFWHPVVIFDLQFVWGMFIIHIAGYVYGGKSITNRCSNKEQRYMDFISLR